MRTFHLPYIAKGVNHKKATISDDVLQKSSKIKENIFGEFHTQVTC